MRTRAWNSVCMSRASCRCDMTAVLRRRSGEGGSLSRGDLVVRRSVGWLEAPRLLFFDR